MTVKKKKKKKQVFGKDVEKLEPLCTADRNGATAMENSLAVSQNV